MLLKRVDYRIFKMYGSIHRLKTSWKQYRVRLARITSLETGVLLVSLLVAGGIWSFIELAEEVMEGETRHIDKWIILAFRNPADLSDPLGPKWFEGMMRDITALGSMFFLLALSVSVVGFLLLQKKKGMAIYTTAAVSGGLLLSTVLKHTFNRSRPELVSHMAYAMSTAFPSGHSMMSAVVFFTLGGLLARYTSQKRLKVYILSLAILATLLVGISRVYLGVHWPTDVLAGWTAGSSWALLCWVVAFLLQRWGRVETHIET